MGNALGSEKKPKNEESPKKSVKSPEAEKVAKESPAKVEETTPEKTSDKGDTKAKVCTPPKAEEVIQVPAAKASPEKTTETTPAKEDTTETTPTKEAAKESPVKAPEVVVSADEIASIEAAATLPESKEAGLRYDVVLSPAVKSVPKLTPSSSPMTEDALNKKLKEAEDRRKSLDNLRMKNLTDQLAKVEIAQQKREEIETEVKAKAAEKLNEKLVTAEENKNAQIKAMKDKLSDHMDKIDKAQKEIEAQLETYKSKTECQLTEKLEAADENRAKENQEMLNKIREHLETVQKVKDQAKFPENQAELEESMKEKIKLRMERATQLKEKHEEQIRERLAQQKRRAELVRENRERIIAEGGVTTCENQTNESA